MSTEPVPPRPDAIQPAPLAPPPSFVGMRRLGARPSATWRWYEALGVYLGAFFLAAFAALPVISILGDDDFGGLVATIAAALLIVAILLLWLRHSHPRWWEILGPPARWWPEIRAGVVFGIGLYPAVVFIVGLILVVLLRWLSGDSVQAPEQVSQGLSAAGIAVMVAYATVVAPLGEELFFRGILFRSIRDRIGFWPGALGSGVAFGLIHYIPGPALDSVLLMSVMVFTGIGLAYTYERRGTIVAPMAAHVTFNIIGLTLIYGLR